MRTTIPARFALALPAISATGFAAAAPPSADTLKQLLAHRLQVLKPDGMTEGNVLFQDVRAGVASNGFYPFQVTALMCDYGPGFPRNRYYGET